MTNIDRLQQLLGYLETTEEKLVVANAYLAAIFEDVQDAIIAKNMDRKITAWNKAAEELYGFSSAEAINSDISLIVPDEKRDELDSIMERLRQGIKIPAFETIRRTKDGRFIPVVVTISPITDRAGRIIGASSIARPKDKNE
jgi:PAS domain S-box-containing protein